jgi:hypothetical protein
MAALDERLPVQGLQVAGVAAVVTTGLLIVNFLDHPYGTHAGGIQPTAMRHALTLVHKVQPSLRAGCSDSGRPL